MFNTSSHEWFSFLVYFAWSTTMKNPSCTTSLISLLPSMAPILALMSFYQLLCFTSNFSNVHPSSSSTCYIEKSWIKSFASLKYHCSFVRIAHLLNHPNLQSLSKFECSFGSTPISKLCDVGIWFNMIKNVANQKKLGHLNLERGKFENLVS